MAKSSGKGSVEIPIRPHPMTVADVRRAVRRIRANLARAEAATVDITDAEAVDFAAAMAVEEAVEMARGAWDDFTTRLGVPAGEAPKVDGG